MSVQVTGIKRSDERTKHIRPNFLHKSIAAAGWVLALPFNLTALTIDSVARMIPSTEDNRPSAWGYKRRGRTVRREPVVYGDGPIRRLRGKQLDDALAQRSRLRVQMSKYARDVARKEMRQAAETATVDTVDRGNIDLKVEERLPDWWQ